MGDGFVHRDISPSNVLIRTSHLSVAEQAEEGAFNLCLIDFGSSVQLDPAGGPGYTMRHAVLRRATPDYAPPEMLTDDLQNLAELRKSEKIDVYAASSVLFELVCGVPPFALEGRMGESLNHIKMDGAAPPPGDRPSRGVPGCRCAAVRARGGGRRPRADARSWGST